MPRRTLLLLTYGIALIPCFLQIYLLSEPVYGLYLIRVLCLFALLVAGQIFTAAAPRAALSIIQILYAAWFCRTYGELAVVAAISPVFLYMQLPRPYSRWILFGFHIIALNYAVYGQPAPWTAACNLFLMIVGILLVTLRNAAMNIHSSDVRYDDLRRKHYELDETRNRLLLFTRQVEGAAQAEERNRISRQLHDDVGHRLIRAKMMMEAALQVIPRDQDKGMTLLLQIRDQLTSGLDEMRAAVRRMKLPEEASGIHALGRMLEEVGRENGLLTSLTVEGDPYTLYPSQELILYKNAREAITNALKHGHPRSVNILIAYREREVCMEVSNDGTLPEATPSETTGFGLVGMKERCALAGGQLEITLNPSFTITTRLPVERREEIV